MSEAFQAAQYMSSDLLECYRTRSTTNTIRSAQNIEQKLLHSARMFKATHLRLASLEKRIANITSLVRPHSMRAVFTEFNLAGI